MVGFRSTAIDSEAGQGCWLVGRPGGAALKRVSAEEKYQPRQRRDYIFTVSTIMAGNRPTSRRGWG